MLRNPMEIIGLMLVVVGLVFSVTLRRPAWRGYGLLSAIILGIVVGNIGLIAPAKGFLTTWFLDATDFFIALMVITVDVRSFAKVALRPFVLYWLGAVCALAGGVVAFLLYRGQLGQLAPFITSIATGGAFGHTETEVAIGAAFRATQALAIVFAIAQIRTILVTLLAFGTIGTEKRLNQWLKPTFFYKGQESHGLGDGQNQQPVSEASIGLVMGIAALLVIVSVLGGPYLHLGDSGSLVLLTTLGLAVGTFLRKQMEPFRQATHSMGLFVAFFILTIVGANTPLAGIFHGALPVVASIFIIMIFTVAGIIGFGKLLRVDWATIATTLVIGDIGIVNGTACTVAYDAFDAVPVTVVVSLSGSVFGIYIGLLFTRMLLGG